MTENFKESYQGWGGDSHPAQEPQAQNDLDTSVGFQLYDRPEIEPGTGDYNFVFANGQLHVSAEHDHNSLAEHAGVQADKPGPSAVGKVEVDKGRAHWLVKGNIALSSVAKELKDYTKQVGWKWGGLASLDGNSLGDEYMPKKAMYFWTDPEGKARISNTKRGYADRIVIQGKTATVEIDYEIPEGVRQWAKDAGYRLADVTPPGNMNDMLKRNQDQGGEDLEQFDMGANNVMSDPNDEPELQNGLYHYRGKQFATYEDYLSYKRALTKDIDKPVDGSGNFPALPDMDKPLPNNFHDQAQFFEASWRFAEQMPKDMLESHIPFIFDIENDKIVIGHQGAHTSDIPGEFTPGGIVEGEYAPGGKVTITTTSNMPWTVRHFVDLWYWQHQQMEVTGVEIIDADGKKRKLASEWTFEDDSARLSSVDVGHYLRTLAMADPAVDRAYKALKDAGGQVYVVGGAVRDALLNKQPKDIDLMVQGVPGDVVNYVLSKLEGNVDLTGKSFGVYRYRVAGHEVEIALPRTEVSTGDKRTDFDIKVDKDIPVEQDLQRRDFTANAMAVNLDDGKLIDPFGGAEDLDKKRLDTVSENSFKEDPTRLLRGLVASSRHGLIPTEKLRGQMAENAHRLGLESPDRIGAEMDKLMKSDNPAGAIRLAKETGLLKHLIPELHNHFDFDQNNPHHNHTLGQHTLSVLEGVQNASDDPDLRMAALFHDLGKPKSAWRNPETGFNHYYKGPNGEGDWHEKVGAEIAGNRLSALRWPKKRAERIQHLINHHMFSAFDSERGARKFINNVGDEHVDDLLTFRHADQYGKGTDEYQDTKTPVSLMRGHVQRVRETGAATKQSDLPITGKDVMQHLGIPPGPAVGQALQRATEKVLEDPSFNNRNDLLNFLSDGPT